MAIWRAFIDDSSSEGAILDYDFKPKPIQKMNGESEESGAISPAMAVGLISVRGANLNAIVSELNTLRRRVRDKYNLPSDSLPRFHMRHLWGTNPNYDKGRNPFYELSLKERFQIARWGYEFLSKACIRYEAKIYAYGIITQNFQISWSKFYDQPRALVERDIIASHFGKKRTQQLYNRILNPVMSNVSTTMHHFDSFCGNGNHNGVICYDTSEASKGFEADELYDALKELGWANHINSSSHGPLFDECLLQLADMVSFSHFKYTLDLSRGHDKLTDPNFSRLVNNIKMLHLPEHKASNERNVTTHYIVARQFLLSMDSNWVDKYMREASELSSDFISGAVTAQSGAFIIRDEIVDYFSKNGRLP